MASRFTRNLPRGYRMEAKEKWNNPLNHAPIFGYWDDAENCSTETGLLVGKASNGAIVRHDDDRHLITFAGSRAGKGVSLIIPTMLSYRGSVLAIDPKGELATITAARRGGGSDYAKGMGGRVYVLDPFQRAEGAAIEYRAAFNPLADLDHETDAGLMRATLIADSLVIQEQGSGAHFTASARAFLRGLILYVCVTETGKNRSLIRVRELITQPLADFDAMLTHMEEIGSTIGRAASSLKLKADNERASVISTADVQTDFLEDGAMRDVLSGHDFELESLKTGETTATVYLCIPAGRLGTHGRWLRLMVALTMEAMEETGALKDGELPVLFLLDEFAALGHMASIEKAAGQIAGFGVKLWPILQDVTQLKRDYKDSWETFIGNAGMLMAFCVSDVSTTEYVSKLLGKTEIRPISFSTNTGNSSGGASSGQTSSSPVQVVDLLSPHEVSLFFNRRNRMMICKPQSELPFVVQRLAYYNDFEGLYDPAPGHSPPVSIFEREIAAQAEKDAEERAAAERRAEQERRATARRETVDKAATAATDAAKRAASWAGSMGRKFTEGQEKAAHAAKRREEEQRKDEP